MVVQIPRHPRLVVHDGNPLFDEPIEQGRFPHIRPADNGNYWSGHRTMNIEEGKKTSTKEYLVSD
jgi:hypothetical protein